MKIAVTILVERSNLKEQLKESLVKQARKTQFKVTECVRQSSDGVRLLLVGSLVIVQRTHLKIW